MTPEYRNGRRRTSGWIAKPRTSFAWLGLIGLASMALAAETPLREADPAARAAYTELAGAPWREAFVEDGQDDWRERWSLDGLKAEVRTHAGGLFFAAGPIADDHASHGVLWTRPSFAGPLRIDFDYTRMDTVNRGVNILYLVATGTGEGPYAEDIATWSALREIPFMATYFDHMNLLHISYAAYELDNATAPDYVRARRYPRSLAEGDFARMQVPPDYANTGLFLPGQKVHVTVIKTEDWLFFHASDGNVDKLFAWRLPATARLSAGRIGIRHMFQRAALYQHFRVSLMPGK